MGIKCFLLQPIDRVRRSLRRYAGGGECQASGMGYHDAQAKIEDAPRELTPEGYIGNSADPPMEDTRWPKQCTCGYKFLPEDRWQLLVEQIYTRSDTGGELTLREASPGAMWDACWMPDAWKGADGRCLVVKCPDGRDWMIDGRASNCTLPDDTEHRCWIRHGEPPVITVDKNGRTCSAGAGSIQTPGYHGFLKDGEFTKG